MNNQIKSFVDNFIRDHAHKDIDFGYDLAVGCDLSKNIQDDLIKSLLNLDYKTIREIILDHAQCLIDERLSFIENEDRVSNGLVKRVDPINGEIFWNKVGGL